MSEQENKFYAVKASGRKTLGLPGYEKIRSEGYEIIRSEDINRVAAEKIKDNPRAASGILIRRQEETGALEFAPIRESEIAKIDTRDDKQKLADRLSDKFRVVTPFPRNRRGGKRARRAAIRNARPNEQLKQAA